MRKTTHIVLALFVWLLAAVVVEARAQESFDLQLEPCTIELVDGREVEGRLAVQFNMPDRLIVYSPRLAAVRSFLKDQVHALTVDGKRRELNPRRELTDKDKKLLGQVAWPGLSPRRVRRRAAGAGTGAAATERRGNQ